MIHRPTVQLNLQRRCCQNVHLVVWTRTGIVQPVGTVRHPTPVALARPHRIGRRLDQNVGHILHRRVRRQLRPNLVDALHVRHRHLHQVVRKLDDGHPLTGRPEERFVFDAGHEGAELTRAVGTAQRHKQALGLHVHARHVGVHIQRTGRPARIARDGHVQDAGPQDAFGHDALQPAGQLGPRPQILRQVLNGEKTIGVRIKRIVEVGSLAEEAFFGAEGNAPVFAEGGQVEVFFGGVGEHGAVAQAQVVARVAVAVTQQSDQVSTTKTGHKHLKIKVCSIVGRTFLDRQGGAVFPGGDDLVVVAHDAAAAAERARPVRAGDFLAVEQDDERVGAVEVDFQAMAVDVGGYCCVDRDPPRVAPGFMAGLDFEQIAGQGGAGHQIVADALKVIFQPVKRGEVGVAPATASGRRTVDLLGR